MISSPWRSWMVWIWGVDRVLALSPPPSSPPPPQSPLLREVTTPNSDTLTYHHHTRYAPYSCIFLNSGFLSSAWKTLCTSIDSFSYPRDILLLNSTALLSIYDMAPKTAVPCIPIRCANFQCKCLRVIPGPNTAVDRRQRAWLETTTAQ